ncbi:MAG: shikimate kinase [Lachnospiraceae bacterium]|nr:shikimate kinase [Lachnospiraceae bacterium]
MNNIYLVGYMGCGKSAVGRELPRMTYRRFMDTHALIVEQEGMPIPRIFEEKGEAYFRKVETEVLRRLTKEKKRIISCGGGVAMRPENVEEMRRGGKIVLLSARPETILKRVARDENRPLLKGRKTIEGITELMDARLPHYQAAADLTVATDDRSMEEIAKEICKAFIPPVR